jgi:hypothetical protein
MNEWIPIDQKLPDDDTLVLITLSYQEVWVAFRDGDVWRYVSADIVEKDLITHWMRLPAPPEPQV